MKRTAFVPRAILATVVTTSVVPMLATASCSEDTGGSEGGYVTWGVAQGGFSVAAVAYGGFSVAAVAFGGFGGQLSVAAVAFGGFGGAGGTGGAGGADGGGGSAMRMDGVHDWERGIVGEPQPLARGKKA